MTAPVDVSPASATARCVETPIPPAADLSWEAYAGRACYACEKQLTVGAVLVGRAVGRMGAHVLDIDVYACP
ncbi:hypothetical protein [Streptomyces xantholiticus]|uniref:hypothetical protein n=1 Tax=Streptomyces xantholiticus TaxID=68285 RepID=UPI0016793456|nr:hypothetical protein [Streptomyces xantholiticus]GGW29422.1 hypothetical protein GCM10010381_12510 [Streptomyces xantholiticus]